MVIKISQFILDFCFCIDFKDCFDWNIDGCSLNENIVSCENIRILCFSEITYLFKMSRILSVQISFLKILLNSLRVKHSFSMDVFLVMTQNILLINSGSFAIPKLISDLISCSDWILP